MVRNEIMDFCILGLSMLSVWVRESEKQEQQFVMDLPILL